MLDVFGNIVDVGEAAATNTFVIPLVKYPTAEKIAIRRISGKVSVHGLVIYPVVVEGTPVKEALEELARVLGDPLSPENPLVKGLQNIAKDSKVAIAAVKAKEVADAKKKEPFAAAIIAAKGTASPPIPREGLVAYWAFDLGDASDSSSSNVSGTLLGGVTFADGPFGKALKFRKSPTIYPGTKSWDSVAVPAHPKLDLSDNLTLSAWVNYSSIAERWGSQIIWHGDNQLGRDPWTLQLFMDGSILMRSDRSVTGSPKFTVFENELYLSPKGKPMMNQHVSAYTARTLRPNEWYFVAGTIGKVSAHKNAIRLYVNGEIVAEQETDESVNYPTNQMTTTIGAVDKGGNWQNFDGMIDEVRIYNRSLTPAEIKALYQQPRR